MFESIISFFANTDVAALALFLVIMGIHYIVVPFWCGVAASKIKALFVGSNTNRKQMVTRCIYVMASAIAIGVVPYALLWAFTNFATVITASAFMFVMDQAMTRTMIVRDTHNTVFAAN